VSEPVSEVAPAAGALRLLVVEDDPRLLDILTSHLDRMGYAVRGARGGGQALQLLAEAPVDVILSDVRMPGMDGRTLLQVVRERYPDVKLVLMTAFGTVDDAVEAMKEGAYSYLTKPFKIEVVAAVLRNAAREAALGREVASLQRVVRGRWSPERLIGTSPQMQEVRRALREATEVTAPVLITGRSGSGKELAARAIHYGSRVRASGPFVPVNCAAIPEALFESTMFGHRRGAFTGAHESQVGFIEQSSGGSLFLDEVGEIPTMVQAKLLRVLQESELTPVGSSRPIRVDLRVIAATNRNLEAMVRQGEFREDLYYRLNVLRIHMPELAERPADVPALAEHLLLEIGQEHGTPVLGLTDEALEALERWRWPGNVRELRNVLERALIAARGRRIDRPDLPLGGPFQGADAWSASPTGPGPASTAGLTLAEVEKAHVEKVLGLCGWNRSAAAKVLGIDRRTLFSKIQRYGIIGRLRPGPDAFDDGE
jgi:two-component system, NtrC family, response regulator AtoC